jgi:hypothetical protein
VTVLQNSKLWSYSTCTWSCSAVTAYILIIQLTVTATLIVSKIPSRILGASVNYSMMDFCPMLAILFALYLSLPVACSTLGRCLNDQIANVSLADLPSPVGHVDPNARKVSHAHTSNIMMFKRDYYLFDASNKHLFRDNFPIHWIQTLCPNTVEHFNKMPAFDYSDMSGHQPVLTTEGAMVFSCMLRVVEVVAQKIGCRWYMHAGTALGAFVHGGPIPWDDDIDIIVDSACANDLRLEISKFSVDDVKFTTKGSQNGFKIAFDDDRFPMTRRGWRFPFVDVFYFHKNASTGLIHELTSADHGSSGANDVNGTRPMFERPDLKWPEDFFFDVRQYLFGGYFYWAPRRLAESRYSVSRCVRGFFNHRIEHLNGISGTHRIDCCQLYLHFPFYFRKVVNSSVIGEYLMVGEAVMHTTLVNRTNMQVFSSQYSIQQKPTREVSNQSDDLDTVVQCSPASGTCLRVARRALDMSVGWRLWNTTVSDRLQWKDRPIYPTVDELRHLLPNLDAVEVDNSISRSCPFVHQDRFRVIEFNAERGTHWIDIAALFNSSQRLRDADVIILNELDIGMARSGNEHTARLLAFVLGMNYAFSVEFVELTNGVKAEQQATVNMTNLVGIHGNAIFARCPLFNATNIRGPVEPAYFSGKPSFVNGNGYEKRLGQRAILLVTSSHSSRNMVWFRDRSRNDYMILGSVHKLAQVMYSAAQDYIRNNFGTTVVVGGDQSTSFCKAVGLRHFSTNGTGTWPASCATTGRGEGDIICGSANVVLLERPHVLLPCYRNVSLSDHAIIAADFTLPM